MSTEWERQVANTLRLLLGFRKLARTGEEELEYMLTEVCRALNVAITGAEEGPLVLTHVPEEGHILCLRFDGKDLFDFRVSYGAVAAATQKTVARCEMTNPDHREQIRMKIPRPAPPLKVLHYIKVNDHGRWDIQPADESEPQPLTSDFFLQLLNDYGTKGLKTYGK